MADYAPNFTARYKLTYNVFGDQHDLGLRFLASLSQSGVTALAESFLNSLFAALADNLSDDFAIVGAEYSAANSAFFTPVATDAIVVEGTVPHANPNHVDQIVMTTWSGRSLGGHKARLVLFGLYWGHVADAGYGDWVIDNAEQAALGDVELLLPESGMVANDNQVAAFWRPSVSVKVSDAWVKRRKP